MTRADSLELRPQNGRTLAYCMLDVAGHAIVIGGYDKLVFPTEAELAKLLA